MRIRTLIRVAVVLSLAVPVTAAIAANVEDFHAALAKAQAANKQAGALKNQWTTTAATLKAAEAAGAAGKFDEAVQLANEAEALANASIYQAKEQETAWKDAVIR